MQLKPVLAYAVLLTSSAFECVAGGGSVAAWHEALGHVPTTTMEALFLRCSGGPLTCSRRRYVPHRRVSNLRHRGDLYSTTESRALQIIAEGLAEGRVSDSLDDRHKVGTANLSHRREHNTVPDIHALGAAEEQLLHSVSKAHLTFEKQPSGATGNIITPDVNDEKINGSDRAERVRQPAAAASPAREPLPRTTENILSAQMWMVHGRGTPYLPPDKVFAALTCAVKVDVKPEMGVGSFYSESTGKFGDDGTHSGSTCEKFEFPEIQVNKKTCTAARVPRGVTNVTQDSGCWSGSFLHELSVKNHLRRNRSAAKRRAVACLDKKESVHRSQIEVRGHPVKYSCSEENGSQRGLTRRIKQGSLQAQTFPRGDFEELSVAGLASQLDLPTHHHAQTAPAGAYSLIEMWSGGTQESTQSKFSPHAQRSAPDVSSSIEILEHNNLLNHNSLVTITYHFPFQTAESQSIAFILVALPPGYATRDDNLCMTNDSSMPALSCRPRHVDLPERHSGSEAKGRKRTLFVQVSSADHSRELPLGTHRFSVGVRNPAHRLAVGLPKNWWFVTFRFSAGHTVTKHFENGILHEKRKCVWTSWRQETPCSASCGPGFEMWTRSLLAGDDRDCGPEVVKRRCELVSCNINCQLGPWETIIDCTKPCLAQKGKAFQLSVRQVLLDKQGSGIRCEHLYPWDPKLKQGWSDKLNLVVRRTPCPDMFSQECPVDIGCRVERKSNRTITVAYPWGTCPFPCGGIGRITSIIQVANGIPRWIGEREFPSSFQAPCRADKEPVVRRQRCNTFACEDCSIYMETPKQEKAVRAWFFFLPSQAADIVSITIPPGSDFALDDGSSRVNERIVKATTKIREQQAAADTKALQQKSKNVQTSSASDRSLEDVEAAVERRSLPVGPMPEQTVEDILTEYDKGEESAATTPVTTKQTATESHFPGSASLCRQLHASFGKLSQCYVRVSTRYQMSKELVFQLRQHIVPHFGKHLNRPPQQEGEGEAQPPRRPEWIVVPLRLNDGVNTESASHFHMWLMSSNTPRDPEVFTCRVKTPLRAPVNCKYTYSPIHPDDCDKCRQQSSNRILMLRQFSPPKYGGTCRIPQERWQADITLVAAACFKGCSRVRRKTLQNDGLMPYSVSPAGTLHKDTSASSEKFRFEHSSNPPLVDPSVGRSVLSLQMQNAASRGQSGMSE